MEIISTVALISINETLLVQLGSFLLFLFIMNRIMIRPLRRVMRDRIDHVERLTQDIIAAERKLDDILHTSAREENAVRRSAFERKAALEAAGTEEADRIVQAAREEIQALSRKAAAEVARKLETARRHLEPEAEALTLSIMEKILDRRPSS